MPQLTHTFVKGKGLSAYFPDSPLCLLPILLSLFLELEQGSEPGDCSATSSFASLVSALVLLP